MNVSFSGVKSSSACTITGDPFRDGYFETQRKATEDVQQARRNGQLADVFSYKLVDVNGVPTRHYGIVTGEEADPFREWESARDKRDAPEEAASHLRNILNYERTHRMTNATILRKHLEMALAILKQSTFNSKEYAKALGKIHFDLSRNAHRIASFQVAIATN